MAGNDGELMKVFGEKFDVDDFIAGLMVLLVTHPPHRACRTAPALVRAAQPAGSGNQQHAAAFSVCARVAAAHAGREPLARRRAGQISDRW